MLFTFHGKKAFASSGLQYLSSRLCSILKEGEGSLFPFDLSQVGSPPQKVFDILQKDVSEEAFYDKPSWVDPESDACNSLLRQPARSLSRLFFQRGWGFLLSVCVRVHLLDQRVHFVLCVKWLRVMKYSYGSGQEIPRLFLSKGFFRRGADIIKATRAYVWRLLLKSKPPH